MDNECREGKLVEAFNMKGLRKVLRVGVIRKSRNKDIRESGGNKVSWKYWTKAL